MSRGGRRFCTFLVASFFAAIGPGCGSSGDSSNANATSGGAGPGNPGGAEACARYIAARREAENLCGSSVSPSRQDELYARHQRRCETMVAAPGSGVTAAVIDQCADDVRGTCGGDDACTRIIDGVRGSLGEGAGCVYDVQCASGACKKEVGPDGAAHCGKCLPVKQIGESCSEDSCVSGAKCFPIVQNKTSTVLTCVAIREIAEGEPCALGTGPESCAKGLYCRAAVNDLPRICVRPVGEGETCGNSNGMTCAAPLTCVNERCRPRLGAGEPCDGGGCDKGLDCDPASKTCTSVAWLPIGSTCDGKLRRCDRGYCFAPGTSTGSASEGTCIDYVADGQACAGGGFGDGEPKGPACDVTAACRDKRCQLDDPSLCQ